MMSRRKHNSRFVVPAIIQSVELLEDRHLLAAAVPAIQLDNQAPEFLGELDGAAILYVEDNGATAVYFSDGSQTGTTFITTINATVDRNVEPEVLGGALYFVAAGSDGAELWKTNGTAAGTMQHVDLNLGPVDSSPDELTAYAGRLYFAATTAGQGRELFWTDGAVSEISLGAGQVAGTDGIGPVKLFVFDDVLFYSSTATLDLYRTDGTEDGTSVFVEGTIPALPEIDALADVGSFVVGEVNGRMIVHRAVGDASDPTVSLWSYLSASDSQPEVLAEFTATHNSLPGIAHYAISDQRLIFEEVRKNEFDIGCRHRNRIWQSDGATEGTKAVQNGGSGYVPESALMPGAFRGNTFYTSSGLGSVPASTPIEVYDNVPAGVGAIETGSNTYFIDDKTGNHIVYMPNDGNNGLQIFHVSTRPISNPVVIFGELYFTVDDGSESTLWKIDDSIELFDGPPIVSPAPFQQHTGFEVEVSWAALADAVSYDIRATTIEGSVYQLQVEQLGDSAEGQTSPTATLEIFPGTTFIGVRALMKDGSFTDWSRAEFVNEILPPEITNSGGEVSDHDPVFEWTVVNGASSYLVSVDEDGEHLVSRGFSGNSATASKLFWRGRDDPFKDGSIYHVRVQARFPNGAKTEWSESYDFVKLSDGFERPVKVYQQRNWSRSMQPFMWGSHTEGATHELYINHRGDRSKVAYHRTGLPSNSHELVIPLRYGVYEVWARTFFADGSKTRWGSDPMIYHAPVFSPRVNSAIHDPATNTLSIEWNAHDPRISFELYVAANSNWREFAVHETALTQNSYSTRVAISKPQRVWIRATDSEHGRSYWADGGEVKSTFSEVTLATTVTLEDGQYDQTPLISWEARSHVAYFELFIRRPGMLAYRRDLNTNSHVVEEPLPAGENTVWLRAVFTNSSVSRWGTGADFEISEPFTSKVPAFSVTNNAGAWPAVMEATRYEVWVNRLDDAGQTIAVRAFHQRDITDTQQLMELASGNYRGWLRAFSSDNSVTNWSEPVEFSVETTHGESSDELGQQVVLLVNAAVERRVDKKSKPAVERNGELQPVDDGVASDAQARRSEEAWPQAALQDAWLMAEGVDQQTAVADDVDAVFEAGFWSTSGRLVGGQERELGTVQF